MIFSRRKSLAIQADRLTLRLPMPADYAHWSGLRSESAEHLKPWEPLWSRNHLTKRAFSQRVRAASLAAAADTGLPLFIIRREDQQLVGAITLDNVQRGPAQCGTIGYWTGQRYARKGYMREAVTALVHYAFTELDLSRIEAGCLPENKASRGVLEKSGFKYEGVAQSYLQISGRWRTHVLYANLRHDRRGKTDAGRPMS